MSPGVSPENYRDLVPHVERQNFAARMGSSFPALQPRSYRLIGGHDTSYDCLGVVTLLCRFNVDPKSSPLQREQLAWGVTERNRISSTVTVDRNLRSTDFARYCLAGQDQHFGQLGLQRQPELDLSFAPGTLKVAMYITNRPDLRNFHVAVQDRDGQGWISKMGAFGPLILHNTAEDLVSSVFERVVAAYQGPVPTRAWAG